MNIFLDFTLIFSILFFVVLVLLIIVLVEIVRMLISMRKVIKRFEMVSDFKSWINFLRKAKNFFKK